MRFALDLVLTQRHSAIRLARSQVEVGVDDPLALERREVAVFFERLPEPLLMHLVEVIIGEALALDIELLGRRVGDRRLGGWAAAGRLRLARIVLLRLLFRP